MNNQCREICVKNCSYNVQFVSRLKRYLDNNILRSHGVSITEESLHDDILGEGMFYSH